MKLQGNTALITGASRGIGRAIAVAFAQEGANLAVTGRDAHELQSLREQVSRLGVRCCVVVADLAERGAVDKVLEQARADLGRLDILVNNAGIGSSANPKPVVNYDDSFWELSLYVNLTVPYLFCKKALPEMIERHYGRILNIASINGRMASFHGAAYAASKHGLLGLTRTVAMEVARTGVTANAICPGPVRTLINDKRIAYDAQRLGKTVAELEPTLTLIGRRLEAEEIAPLAVYLASKEAAVVTGQAYNIDGGVLMS